MKRNGSRHNDSHQGMPGKSLYWSGTDPGALRPSAELRTDGLHYVYIYIEGERADGGIERRMRWRGGESAEFIVIS